MRHLLYSPFTKCAQSHIYYIQFVYDMNFLVYSHVVCYKRKLYVPSNFINFYIFINVLILYMFFIYSLICSMFYILEKKTFTQRTSQYYWYLKFLASAFSPLTSLKLVHPRG